MNESVTVLETEEESIGTQYLTFLLAEEQYGLNILQVQEIRGWENATRVPNSPEYLRGVLNLRGTIVPIMDLRLRFGLQNGRSYTLEEVGKKFGLTRERIRQIEGQALRKLRHPRRSRQLRDYLS